MPDNKNNKKKKKKTGSKANVKKKKIEKTAVSKKANTELKNKKKDNDFRSKSATLQAVERQRKLEQTMPLGGLTTELPNLGRSLDGPERIPWRRNKKRKERPRIEIDTYLRRKFFVVLGIIATILIAAVVVIKMYTVDTVIIEGNAHYTNDEIYSMVVGDSRLEKSSIYLSLKYRDKEIENIPFIQTMTVNILDRSTIKITVYEKAVAGFVDYMGRYFYFDKDGTVIESSDIITKGIPQVLGLDFDHIILYEKLPIESDEVFRQILEMTQLLEKYDIEMDKLYFDSNYKMTLYFGDARIRVGDFTNIDEKIIRLKTILPELADKKGVLRLDTYDGTDSLITFEVDE